MVSCFWQEENSNNTIDISTIIARVCARAYQKSATKKPTNDPDRPDPTQS